MQYLLYRSEAFTKWMGKLDKVTRGRIASRVKRALNGHFGDHKNLGEGLFELRFDFAHGYRVYYGFWRGIMLLLVSGGDKSGQDADIARARGLLADTVEQLDEEAKRHDPA